MENQIKEIVKKVRQMYKYDEVIGGIVSQPFEAHVSEIGENLQLTKIRFCWYDRLEITSGMIIYYPELRNGKVLLKYNGFEELLKL